MRIASIRQGVVPISSAIANAYIDFSKMTASVVAITVEDGAGKRATGYGFNSNGRYAQPGLLAERCRSPMRRRGPRPSRRSLRR